MAELLTMKNYQEFDKLLTTINISDKVLFQQDTLKNLMLTLSNSIDLNVTVCRHLFPESELQRRAKACSDNC